MVEGEKEEFLVFTSHLVARRDGPPVERVPTAALKGGKEGGREESRGG